MPHSPKYLIPHECNVKDKKMAIRIYADFNAQDMDGRIDLHTVGSRQVLEPIMEHLYSGLPVVLYFDDVEVDAILEYDEDLKRWYGVVPDWSSYRDVQASESTIHEKFLPAVG